MATCYRCRANPAQGNSAYCAECQLAIHVQTVYRVGRFSGIAAEVRGTRLCQCPICHEIFSGESTFVLHRIEGRRVGNPGAYSLGECRDPASKGMRLSESGVWSMPLPVVGTGVNPGELAPAGVVGWGEAA